MASFLRLHPTDNVVVAVAGLSPGDIVDDVKITRRIPPGHKAAVRAIKKDEPALKFGLSHEFIGRADGWPGLVARYGMAQTLDRLISKSSSSRVVGTWYSARNSRPSLGK